MADSTARRGGKASTLVRRDDGQRTRPEAEPEESGEGEGATTEAPLRSLIDTFEIGKQYWFETAIWVYIGRVIEKGTDFIVIDNAVRMHSDGRHHLMMRDGTASGMEVEPTGAKAGIMTIPLEWIGPGCFWPHKIPKEAT